MNGRICEYIRPNGKPCEGPGYWVENGQERCYRHTSKELAKGESVARERIERAEAKVKDLAKEIKLAAEASPLDPVPQGAFLKRFHDQCRVLGCSRPTASKKPEPLAKRYCTFHQPERVQRLKTTSAKGKTRKASCKVQPSVRCRDGRLSLLGGWVPSVSVTCHPLSLVCYDEGTRWKKSRSRCTDQQVRGGVIAHREEPKKPISEPVDSPRERCIHCNQVIPEPGRGLKVCSAQRQGKNDFPVCVSGDLSRHGEEPPRPKPIGGSAWDKHKVLRNEAAALHARGKSVPKIAHILSVSTRTVYTYLKEHRQRFPNAVTDVPSAHATARVKGLARAAPPPKNVDVPRTDKHEQKERYERLQSRSPALGPSASAQVAVRERPAVRVYRKYRGAALVEEASV